MRSILRFFILIIVFIIGFFAGGVYFSDKESVLSKTSNLVRKEIPETTKEQIKADPQNLENKRIYTVQVASFRKISQAEKYVAAIQQKGFDAYIAPRTKRDGLYRICIGESLSKDQALENHARLKSEFKDSFVQVF